MIVSRAIQPRANNVYFFIKVPRLTRDSLSATKFQQDARKDDLHERIDRCLLEVNWIKVRSLIY